MLNNNFFSHTSFNGDTLLERIGYAGSIYFSVCENIAMGYLSEESVTNGMDFQPGNMFQYYEFQFFRNRRGKSWTLLVSGFWKT